MASVSGNSSPGIVSSFESCSTRLGSVMEEDMTSEPSAEDVGARDENNFLEYANSVSERLDLRRLKRRMFLGAGLAAAVVVVIALIVVGGAGPGSTDAAAQVIRGARATLAERTADLEISGSLTADGQSIPLSGSGWADLSSGLETMTLNTAADGKAVQETEILDGPSLYMEIMENNQNAVTQLIPGKSWVQLPFESLTDSGLGQGSPNILAQLQLLTAQGNTVESLGPSTINGEAVNGYQVTITKKGMAAGLKRAEARGGAEASAIKAALTTLSLSPPVIDVWIDSTGLLQREKVVLSMSSDGTTAGGDVEVDFSNYGSQTTVTIPPASEIVTYGAFLSAATAAG